MMRKLLYSFLFFIFLHSAGFAQCGSYPSFTTTKVGASEYTFCTNTTSFTQSLRAEDYVTVNVIKGSTYRFRIPSIWTGNNSNGTEYLGVFDDAPGNALLAEAAATNTTTVNFTPTVSGKVRVLLLRGTSCTTTTSNTAGTLTMTQTTIGNTQDDQNSYGTNNWVAHVYSAGGEQPTSFNYLGYYNVSTESISENFGGSLNCFPFMSGGINRGQVYTEGFAVRHKMKTTKSGCYMITVSGDDGLRLYLNGTNILDRWVEQGSTTYSNVIVNLDGDDDLIFDYYENQDANSVTFTMVPFDTNSNTITAPATVDFCGSGTPSQITGSLQYSSADPNLQNPLLSFQWQSSTDGVAFNNINGATSRNYTPPTITAPNILYYRRLVNINGISSGCSYTPSNVVRITASSNSNPTFTGATMTGATSQCTSATGQVYSVVATNATSYNWSVPSGWTITSGQGTNSITVTVGTTTGTGSVSVVAGNGCGTNRTATRSLAVTVNALPTAGLSSSDSDNTFCVGTSVTFTASGGTSYVFKVGSSVVQSGNSATYTTTALTNGQVVTVDVTNASGCTRTSAGITNTVNARPTAGLSSSDSDNTFCAGTSVTFTASGGTSYVFKVGSTTVQSGTNSTYTTSSLTNGQVVTVDVTNASGCTATSAGITNTVNPVHTISAGANRSVCQNIAMTPIALTLGGGATDAVVTGLPSGVTSSVTGNTLTISGNPIAIGIFNYNVTTTGNSCTTATTTGTITVGIGNNIITYNNGNSNSVCVAVDENQTAIFTAPAGTYFNTISFASYGSPTGSCGAFQINYVCHSAVKSQSYTESSLLGNTGTINVVANNENFDDPCVSTFKAYKAVARYSEPICAGTIPGQISGSAPTGGGTYAYLWEMSTTSSTSGFSAAPGTNNSQNYIPTVQVTRDTWFRRTVTSGGTCPNVSAVVLIKVNPSPTLAGASQSVSVCSGSAATINLTGLLAGSTSTISYSINSVAQTPITSLVATSGGTASFTTPVLTEVNDGQILQITGVTTTSSTPNCSLSFSTNVTLSVNPTPTLTGASQPLSVCTGSAATINLTGLLAGSTSTISYSINSVAQTPITSVIATAGGTASFTTPALTYANNGQSLRITQITTTSSTPNCSSAFTSDVILSVNATPTTPTIAKNNDAACNTLGSITITGLSGNWTVNQTGATTLPKSYPGPGASLAIQDLAADTYSFTVANNDTGCTSSAVTVTITDTSSNTDWGPSGWTNGEPDGSKSVTISSLANGQPFSLAKPNITACSLTITVGSDVIIPSGVTLEITNKVTSNGRLVFESGSSLIQTTNVQNSGDIVYKRATSIRRFDLTYWSSPITSTKQDGFMMKDLSPETLFDKYSYWSSSFKWATDLYGNMEMKPGIGYSIRGPQSFSIETPAEFIGKFSGIPNNGDIPISTTPDKYLLIGNPYPSAIDGRKFITDNGDVGALYFWTHVSLPKKAEGSNTYRYSSPDYAVFTLLGATRATTGGETPSGYIGVGQGFFIKPKVTSIKFNNGQRVKAENSQFFKTTAKEAAIEVNRLWLNLSNTDDAYKQILIGYAEGATNSFDYNYDAVTLAGNTYVDFYTINEAQKLSIQARSLPFDNTERIPLGYKSVAETQLTISIDHADGFFNKQAVYLEDKTTGTITDLRASNYTFKTGIGTFTDRFVLRYTNKTLGTDDIENLGNSVLISVKNKTVSITCSKETIKDVTIFNVGGQLVYSKNKVNSSELQITNLHSSDQVLLVKVTLENGSIITKKVIFSNL